MKSRGFLKACFVLLVSIPLSTMAHKEPDRAQLLNFDVRLQAAQRARANALGASSANAASTNAVRAAAEKALAGRVAGLRVERHEALGTVSLISSPKGFLTGPNGQGGAVSAKFLQKHADGDEHRVVKAFLDEHASVLGHDASVLTAARVKRNYVSAHNGLRTVIWHQELDGIEIYEATLVAHVTKNEELVNVASHMLPNPAQAANAGTANRLVKQTSPTITAAEAIARAAQNVGEELSASQVMPSQAVPEGAELKQKFRAAPVLNGDTDARLVWLPMETQTLKLCWEIVLTSRARGEMFKVLIDAETGDAFLRHGLTEYISAATYNVYTSDSPSPFSPGHPTPLTNQPPYVLPTMLTFAALNTNASPDGWIPDGGNETLGNNVDAHLDRDNNNIADLPRPQGSPLRVFNVTNDLSIEPTNTVNAQFAVVQLFYWNNFIHDKLYALGFTEAAGNFQSNNFGRGGVGNDAVQADAQDGGGFNNANMSTPADGSAPRMQMYLFSGPTPDRDGDLDAEIVLHEYTHGLSNRRVGGGVGISAFQTRGMGEGWSDFYGLSLLSEPADNPNGNYAAGAYATYLLGGDTANYYNGIRRYPYSTDMTKNPLTFKDIDPAQQDPHTGIYKSNHGSSDGSEVHNQGEVWCMTLWEARANLVAKYGFAGNQIMLQLVTDGMALAPANPTFLQARDAIIQADLVNNGGANRFELWAGFAKRGMGYSATSPASSTTTGVVEAFDIPDDLGITPNAGISFSGFQGGQLNPACQTYVLTNSGSNTLSWSLANTSVWLTVSPVSGTLAPGQGASVTACLNGNASSLTAGTYADSIAFSNITSTALQRRAVTLRVFPVATMPFNDTFESGGLQSFYNVTGTGAFRAQVVTNNTAHDGSFHLTMDDSDTSTNNFARNEVTLGINLAGYTNAVLRFWAKGFSDEAHGPPPSPFTNGFDFDGVAISTDGVLWYEVQGLRTLTSTYTEFAVDLNAATAARGLSLNSAFLIRFNQYDDQSITFDGIAIDDITITAEQPPMPAIYIFDTSLTEGAAGTTNNMSFTVRLSKPSLVPVTVNFATQDTFAIAGVDYVATNGLVTFAPGVTNQTIVVKIIGDALDENNETFRVLLSNAVNATLADAQAVGTITDDDATPTLVFAHPSIVEGNVGANNYTLPVSLSAVSGRSVSVFYTTATNVGGAVSGVDFLPTSGTINFPPGMTVTNIPLTILSDTTIESNEVFRVAFSSAVNVTLTNTSCTNTIVNDDGLPGQLYNFSWSPIGSPQAAGVPFLVNLAALDGSNNPAVSFSGPAFLSGFVTSSVPPATTILISELQPNTPDFIEFVNMSNGPVSISGWQITLYDFGSYPGPMTNFVVPAGSIVPAGGVFRLNEFGAAPGAYPNFNTGANIDWSPSGLSAIAVLLRDAASNIVDFVCVSPAVATAITNPVVIPTSQWSGASVAGTASSATSYQRIGSADNNNSGDWTVAVPSGGTNNVGLTAPLVPGLTAVSITPTTAAVFTNGVWAGMLAVSQPATNMVLRASDNNGHTNLSNPFDVAVSNSLAIASGAALEGNSGTTNILFNVTLSPSRALPVTVNFATVDGSATAGSDYTATNGTLNFAPGETNKTILVTVSGDTELEPNESFLVRLSNASGAYVGDGVGVGTILNDDAALPLSNQPRNDFWMPNNTVNAVLETNGTIYLGGAFTEIGLTNLGRLVPFDPDTGDVLPDFPIADQQVNAVLDDGNGGWFIGGNFTSVGGVPRFRLAHLNADRSVDTNFTANCGSIVNALVRDATNLYVGGSFVAVTNGGTNYPRSFLAILDPVTGVPRNFPTNPAFNTVVNTLALQPPLLYAGGLFTNIAVGASNYPRARLAAIDTANATPTAFQADVNATVNTVAVNSNSVFFGGLFTNVAGQTRGNFAAVDPGSGAVLPLATVFNSTVQSLFVNGSNLYVGGFFSTVSNAGVLSLRTNLVAIDATTGVVQPWQPAANGVVRSMALSGSNLVVGGDFTAIGGQSDRRRLAMVSTETGVATAFDPDVGNSVFAVSVRSNVIYAGGSFSFVKGTPRNRLAAVDAVNGALLPWNPNANSTVQALAADGTNIFAAGFFTTMGGVTRTRLAAVDTLNGNVVTAFSNSFNNTTRALVVGGGNLYVGGDFTSVTTGAGAFTRQGMAAVDPTNGAIRTNFVADLTPAASLSVNVLALAYSEAALYLGGAFTNVANQPRFRIAAVDPVTGALSSWNPNLSGTVNSLFANGSTVIAGGAFTAVTNGIVTTTRNRLAALDIDTGVPTAWNPNMSSTVNALAARGTNLYAGGAFITAGGLTRSAVAELDDTLATSLPTAWFPNLPTIVNSLYANTNRLVVGGSFAAVGTQARPFFAVFQPNIGPVITGSGGAITYTENDPPVIVDSGITLNDSDSTTMASATVRIATNLVSAEDVLEFAATNGISANFSPGGGMLTLSGQSAKSNYLAALRAVTYRNSSGTPSPSPRTLVFSVNDGVTNSPPVTRVINVVPVNDPPVLSAIPSATTVENWISAAVPFTVGDEETAATDLFLSAIPANPVLAPSTNIIFGGSGSNRTVRLLPGTNQSGSTTITIFLSDGTNVVSTPLLLTVLADTDHDGIPDVYESNNGMNPNDPADASLDFDGDGMTNLQEYLAGTNPNDPNNYLRVIIVAVAGTDAQITFTSIIGKSYRVEKSDDVSAGVWTLVADNVPGTGGNVIATDPGGASLPQRAYRVRLLP